MHLALQMITALIGGTIGGLAAQQLMIYVSQLYADRQNQTATKGRAGQNRERASLGNPYMLHSELVRVDHADEVIRGS